MTNPIPSVAEVSRFIGQIAAAQPAPVVDRLKQIAARRPQDHGFLHLGATSVVALPVVVAGLQSGVIRNYLMVSQDKPRSVGASIGRGLEDFAKDAGANVVWLNSDEADALLAGKTNTGIPPLIKATMSRLTSDLSRFSVIDSIAKGVPGPVPGRPDRSLVDLTRRGTLRRTTLRAATVEEQRTTHNNMGINPGLWRKRLEIEGRIQLKQSIGLNFSWWGNRPHYQVFLDAKRQMEKEAAEWYEEYGDSWGFHGVVMSPLTPSPGLSSAVQGLLIGVESIYQRSRRGDTLSFAEIGALALLGVLDQKFAHPLMEREGAFLRFDRAERESFAEIEAKLEELDRAVPLDLEEEFSPARSDSILRQVMGWPEGWKEHLQPVRFLEEAENSPKL